MAVKTSDLKEWGIVKKLNDMMCDELFGPEEFMTDDLVARLRVFHEYDADKSSFILEAADRIEQLEAALRVICDGPRDADKSYPELLAEVRCEARAALEGKDG